MEKSNTLCISGYLWGIFQGGIQGKALEAGIGYAGSWELVHRKDAETVENSTAIVILRDLGVLGGE